MNHELTAEQKDYLKILITWKRGRYINYASKTGQTYNQAVNYIFRRPFEEQKRELDRVVDPEFHSSMEPKMITETALVNG